MVALFVLVLMAVCAKLWNRTAQLELRVDALEMDLAMARGAVSPPDRIPTAVAVPVPAYAPPPVDIASLKRAEPIETFDQPVDELADSDLADSDWTASERSAPQSRGFSFEQIFGRYLPIWAGGITLAVAGFLIVKYSIDAGLMSPAIRVVCGILFGSGLIAAAEAALRRDDVVRDARIRQALSGAGIATLYASVLVAANVYSLIAPMTAFVGLAGITVLAGLLSIRFGAPSAVLGLVGGLAAPALVGSASPDVPLLATYLALTVGGLSVLGRTQRWWWLGALAVVGGFGWGLLLIVSGLHGTAETLSVGTLTLMLAIAFPLAIVGTPGRTMRLGGSIAGCAQMAALVAIGGFAPLDWALYGLISAAAIWLSWRDARIADMPIAGLAIGVLLTMAWPEPTAIGLAAVLGGGALIYGVPALWRLWRADGTIGDAIQLATIAGGIVLIPMHHLWHVTPRSDFAPLALLGAAIAGASAAIGWRLPERRDARFAILSVSAIMLVALAAALLAPVWAIAAIVALASIASLWLARRADDVRIEASAGAMFGAATVLLVLHDASEMLRALGAASPSDMPGLIRWAVAALAAFAFARWSSAAPLRSAAGGVATLFGYVALAQVVPAPWLALVPAAMLVALAARGQIDPALAMAAALAAAWALQPLALWLLGGAASLTGLPFYAAELPRVDDTLVRIAAPAIALIVLLSRRRLYAPVRIAGAAALAALATISAHVLWKQLFALDVANVAANGMAERTLWEAVLAAAAMIAWKLGARRVALGLGSAALLHFGWYTVLLHNPLWSDQLAGPWLIPAYALAFALVWLSRDALPDAIAERVRDGIRMVLIVLLAASLLRQAFHGSLLSVAGVSPAEDIGRSLLAIALAIGFLQWGIRRARRDWRIASLVLMLVAVSKVFLIDAAGLDGLVRIGSFAALGFSLIGVGWLYSRYLPDPLTQESHSNGTNHADIRG